MKYLLLVIGVVCLLGDKANASEVKPEFSIETAVEDTPIDMLSTIAISKGMEVEEQNDLTDRKKDEKEEHREEKEEEKGFLDYITNKIYDMVIQKMESKAEDHKLEAQKDAKTGVIQTESGCVFPFVYKGTKYHGCTTKDYGQTPWCALTPIYENGKWKKCPVKSVIQTESGCVFPFVYKGTKYHGCTTKDYGQTPWCALTPIYENSKWKKCPIKKNECKTKNPCSNGAKCEDTADGYRCICAKGFSGKHCDEENECKTKNPCSNGAKCEDTDNGYRCVCGTGFSGKHCREENKCVTEKPCKNGATCEKTSNGYRCKCQKGFTGPSCEIRVVTVTKIMNEICKYPVQASVCVAYANKKGLSSIKEENNDKLAHGCLLTTEKNAENKWIVKDVVYNKAKSGKNCGDIDRPCVCYA